MKEKLKKIFPSIKSWVVKHEFLAWTFASVLFAFVIHCLFSKEAPTEWLGAEWTAGEILTYTSTVALGLLALWQNKRFKKANDEAQERMEELTKYANELTLKSQIIDAEAKRINRLKEAIEDFYNTCNPTSICAEYAPVKNDYVIGGTFISDLRCKIIAKYSILKSELEKEPAIDNTDFRRLCLDYADRIGDYINYIESPHKFSSQQGDTIVEKTVDIVKRFLDMKGEYIDKVEKNYNKLVYNDLPLSTIYSMFSVDNHKW